MNQTKMMMKTTTEGKLASAKPVGPRDEHGRTGDEEIEKKDASEEMNCVEGYRFSEVEEGIEEEKQVEESIFYRGRR